MIRLVWMSNQWKGMEVTVDDEQTQLQEMDNIQEFISTGEPVLIVEDLEDLEELGIDPDEVVIFEG